MCAIVDLAIGMSDPQVIYCPERDGFCVALNLHLFIADRHRWC